MTAQRGNNPYQDQRRWNDEYGKAHLRTIEEDPDRFLVDPANLSSQKVDLMERMGDIRGKHILEFGSGQGELSVVLAKSGGVVTGIDIGEDLVRLAQKVAALNNVNCRFMVGNIDELHFENNSFDFIVGSAILHHLSQEGVKNSLKEACRVLKPGGMALFIEPIEDSRLFDFIQNLFPVGGGATHGRPSILQRKKWKAYLEEADDRNLSTGELAEARGDFETVEFRYYGMTIRLARFPLFSRFRRVFNAIDSLLTHSHSPLKVLGQTVFATYRKRGQPLTSDITASPAA